MSRNELYVRGDENLKLPVHLNFGKYMLDQLQVVEDKVALVNATTGEQLTYAEIVFLSVNLATAFSELGIGKGDVVAVGSEKRNIFIPTALGAIFTGATFTSYSLDDGNAVLQHKLSIAKPTYFIFSKHFWDRYQEILTGCSCIKTYITFDDSPRDAITIQSLMSKNNDIRNFEPAKVLGQIDTALIIYSSGTTGMPKGVRLTHLNCIVNSLPDNYIGDNICNIYIPGSWYHNYSSFMTFKFLSVGKTLIYVVDVTLHNILECTEKYQVDMLMIYPHLLNLITKEENLERFNLDSVQLIYSRSSLLHKNTIEKVKQRLPKVKSIMQGYGISECGEPTSEFWATKGPKSGSVGMAAPGVVIKIVDKKTHKILGANQLGEIRINCPMLMKEYIQIDPSTYLDEEGFFKTGDVGYYDDDKYFYIIDRIKDIIVSKSYNIGPLEIESVLEKHPNVLEAGVIGKPDDILGEVPMAFVVKKQGLNVTEQELLDFTVVEVSPHMALKGGIIFIQKLPRNPRGKILRQQLREMLKNL